MGDYTYSFVKKVTSSGGFRRYLTSDGIDPIGTDVFWQNFIDYYQNKQKIGLSNHERNGFSNYMTKVFSGSDLSRDDIVVDDLLYNKAKDNLNKTYNFTYLISFVINYFYFIIRKNLKTS